MVDELTERIANHGIIPYLLPFETPEDDRELSKEQSAMLKV